MEPDSGPARERGEEAPGRTDTRATVEWYFGDLVDSVASDHGIARDGLVAALARIEREARTRRDQLEERGGRVSTAGAPGDVLALPVGTFRVLTRVTDLADEEASAVRSVHRQMANALAEFPDGDDVEPFVYAVEPSDIQ